jgi:predicted O-linked N-acetylglucosamine transferase (SPINDLY family)
VLGEMPRDGFLSHIAVCDVALDTFGFSGGQTSVDTLSANVPVVTLPGTFMRGRQTAAMLTLISVEELIARDKPHYVELALRLVDDASSRTQLREKISRNKSLLFADRRPVIALTQWLSTLPVAPPPA